MLVREVLKTPELWWNDDWGKHMIKYWWHPQKGAHDLPRLDDEGYEAHHTDYALDHEDAFPISPRFKADMEEGGADMASIVAEVAKDGWVRMTVWGKDPNSLEVTATALTPRLSQQAIQWAVRQHPGIDRAEVEIIVPGGRWQHAKLADRAFDRFLKLGVLPAA